MFHGRPFLLVSALFVLALSLPSSAQAAGCHTACNLTVPPDCLGCSFVMFGNVMCIRVGCDACLEDACWMALPTATDPLAQAATDPRQSPTCTSSPERRQVPARVVAVQALPART